jgi:ATP-dependent RNA helicase DeaD
VRFSELSIHPALGAALAARGYETPTGVQAAVLDAGVRGRDLLVSSHTGSGKTVAFGAAMADSLLPAGETRVSPGPNPIALVVVPTRELAVQVREELRWLFASTHLRLASFTGGTPVGGDLRTLQRGVELVIGTPGRLVDLLRRERLKLSDVRVVVLDEADEMLDLGFRQDLETLLQAAPATRRTLLLSATLPAEIRALAQRYQRDAIAIDPRKSPGAGPGGGAGRGAHEDITHRAHLIAGGDRLAAVVNVLRAGEVARAIVFCTTREGVAEMHAALTARGFTATAISGERAQAERDRALDQLRRGEARVLVATNVAARGLHLPDVDLIVHADLPLNADSLIHRSGRTGRAGRKGTAVVIATVAERRKAERLLGAAHVKVDWTPPPSADAIAAAARARLADELAAGGEPPPGVLQAADDLLARVEAKLPARQLLQRLLARELDRLPVGETLRAIPIPAAGTGGRAGGTEGHGLPARRRTHNEFAREGVAFRINLGADDRADPRWLLPLICRRGGVTRREVGAIRVGPHETQFEIAGDAAHDFAQAAAEPDQRARHVVIERVHAQGGDRPPQPHHARGRERPPERSPGEGGGDRPPQPHHARGRERAPERSPGEGGGERPPQPHHARGRERPPERSPGEGGHRPPRRHPERPPVPVQRKRPEPLHAQPRTHASSAGEARAKPHAHPRSHAHSHPHPHPGSGGKHPKHRGPR